MLPRPIGAAGCRGSSQENRSLKLFTSEARGPAAFGSIAQPHPAHQRNPGGKRRASTSANPALGLDVANAAAAPYGLKVGLVWFIPGMLLVTAYFLYTYRNFAGKVRLDEQGSTAS